jgi:hypothetical protein
MTAFANDTGFEWLSQEHPDLAQYVDDFLVLRALPSAHEWMNFPAEFPVESPKFQEMMRVLAVNWELTLMRAATRPPIQL